MLFRAWVLAALAFGQLLASESGKREAPSYTAASVVNAATNLSGVLAPNTIATLYGTGLSYTTRAVSTDDIGSGVLPLVLPGSGVRVSIGEAPAHIYYVSPTQVNFLVPGNLSPGPAEMQLTLDGRAGPAVKIQLASAAPALFKWGEKWIVACRADGSGITSEVPARPGEIIILYATGLGRTTPNPRSGELPKQAAPLEKLSDFRVLLNGDEIPAGRILYAGVAPGYAGLYQINLQLPDSLSANPEIRLRLGDEMSPAGGSLPAAP